ncbi:TetR/AcrR family transcriptional regulator [Actinomadura barringtoniae]|uniref:TetR/AcrR family transcriptional regulator n=1 Tax=Actinomadura barringtoniae TaxID=1427535 RepID=A0A939T7H5_9ACTN|nr:TetR/AcrR family transcriptional regulator [Actinomadura barringtoniae]MBO2445885.1 TetR/AcrR family transcriptional regulator [Actinomadura barringtoniae]
MSDTREQIRRVALELFAEQGYEKTSLREIAERLDVTKAALYYHFKSKEAIVTSLFEELEAGVDKILTWAEERPMTPDARQEIIRRYAELLRGPGGDVMRFMAENGPAIRDLKAGNDARERFIRLAGILSDKNAPLPDQLRARLSIFSLHMSVFLMRDLSITDDERHDAALQVALDLVDRSLSE